ncbi:hypothetical protein [Candidatus Binatus sp.]|jgi:hypothetical protein|uniref:hypothetical protein n=1 Tax=Candidatus Binatus sp. TaxID=2811406 RepID=UPI003CB334E2
MISTQPARLIVTISAALALTVFVNPRFAFSQEVTDPSAAGDSSTPADSSADADSGAVAESGTSVDASWERSGPAIDENAETADQVLEIPQATCPKDGAPASCDTSSDDDNDDDGEAINAPSPGAPPTDSDDDSASSGSANPDWGTADDYQNQQIYEGYPYPYQITVAVPQRLNRPSQVSPSAFAPMSSPITQAALPPLNQGPWMNPPTMSAFSRPAGSPMMPMMMSGRSFGFHR